MTGLKYLTSLTYGASDERLFVLANLVLSFQKSYELDPADLISILVIEPKCHDVPIDPAGIEEDDRPRATQVPGGPVHANLGHQLRMSPTGLRPVEKPAYALAFKPFIPAASLRRLSWYWSSY